MLQKYKKNMWTSLKHIICCKSGNLFLKIFERLCIGFSFWHFGYLIRYQILWRRAWEMMNIPVKNLQALGYEFHICQSNFVTFVFSSKGIPSTSQNSPVAWGRSLRCWLLHSACHLHHFPNQIFERWWDNSYIILNNLAGPKSGIRVPNYRWHFQ